jgi:predicted DNA-binding transcriptional regulator YafY
MLALPRSEKTDSISPLVRPQRLLKLISLLEAGRAITGDSLAQSLGVCRRTVFRDVKVLRGANIPIYFDSSDQGYRIRRNAAEQVAAAAAPSPESTWVHDGAVCRCPKIIAEEIAALLLALRVAGPLPDTIVDACESALVKIMAAALPAARQRAVNIMEESFEPSETPMEFHLLPLRPSG